MLGGRCFLRLSAGISAQLHSFPMCQRLLPQLLAEHLLWQLGANELSCSPQVSRMAAHALSTVLRGMEVLAMPWRRNAVEKGTELGRSGNATWMAAPSSFEGRSQLVKHRRNPGSTSRSCQACSSGLPVDGVEVNSNCSTLKTGWLRLGV